MSRINILIIPCVIAMVASGAAVGDEDCKPVPTDLKSAIVGTWYDMSSIGIGGAFRLLASGEYEAPWTAGGHWSVRSAKGNHLVVEVNLKADFIYSPSSPKQIWDIEFSCYDQITKGNVASDGSLFDVRRYMTSHDK